MRSRILAALALVLVIAAPTLASADGWRRGSASRWHRDYHGHWRSGPRVYLGFGYPGYPYYGWGPGWGPGWGWWFPTPPVYVQERTVVTEPPVYVERDGEAGAPDGYWYFCRPKNAYYPDVQNCPEPWIPVPPRTQ